MCRRLIPSTSCRRTTHIRTPVTWTWRHAGATTSADGAVKSSYSCKCTMLRRRWRQSSCQRHRRRQSTITSRSMKWRSRRRRLRGRWRRRRRGISSFDATIGCRTNVVSRSQSATISRLHIRLIRGTIRTMTLVTVQPYVTIKTKRVPLFTVYVFCC